MVSDRQKASMKYVSSRINKKSAIQCTGDVRMAIEYGKCQKSNKIVCHYKDSTSAYTGLAISVA